MSFHSFFSVDRLSSGWIPAINLGQAQTFQPLYQPVRISLSVTLVRGHFGHLEPSVLADKVATTFLTHVSCAVSEHPRVPSAQVACWVITGCTSSTQAETAKLLSNTGVPLPHVQNRTQSPVTTRFYHTRLSKTY